MSKVSASVRANVLGTGETFFQMPFKISPVPPTRLGYLGNRSDVCLLPGDHADSQS